MLLENSFFTTNHEHYNLDVRLLTNGKTKTFILSCRTNSNSQIIESPRLDKNVLNAFLAEIVWVKRAEIIGDETRLDIDGTKASFDFSTMVAKSKIIVKQGKKSYCCDKDIEARLEWGCIEFNDKAILVEEILKSSANG